MKPNKRYVKKTLGLTEDSRRLLSNFFSLTVLQGVNMALPLLILPYLLKILGVEIFGLLNFALSIIMYFQIFVGFGFELSATRDISVNRDNVNKISEIFSTVMCLKLIFLISSLIILTLFVFAIKSFYENSTLFYATFGLVFGNVLFPTWFFQGMERMKYITYISVVSNMIFTVLIFVFVKGADDFIYVPVLNSAGTIIAGTFALFLVFRLYNLSLIVPSKLMIISTLKDSYRYFLSRVANDGSRYLTVTIIGLCCGNILVGYYSLVEKVFRVFLMIGGLVAQTIFPYMSRTKDVIFFKKVTVIVILISVLFLIPCMYYNVEIFVFIFSVKSIVLSNLFYIVFSGGIFGVLSSLLGYPLLAAFGFVKHANNSLIYSALIYSILVVISGVIFKNIYYVSASFLFYEVCGCMLRLYYAKKEKLI